MLSYITLVQVSECVSHVENFNHLMVIDMSKYHNSTKPSVCTIEQNSQLHNNDNNHVFYTNWATGHLRYKEQKTLWMHRNQKKIYTKNMTIVINDHLLLFHKRGAIIYCGVTCLSWYKNVWRSVSWFLPRFLLCVKILFYFQWQIYLIYCTFHVVNSKNIFYILSGSCFRNKCLKCPFFVFCWKYSYIIVIVTPVLCIV